MINVCILNPINFIVPERFDILAKVIYARYKLMGINSDWATELYKTHIKVFNNGVEIGGSKKTVNDFVTEFNKIIESLKTKGFTNSHEVVPIGNDNIIINGAHRIGIAVALGLNIRCNIQPAIKATVYDYNFFRTRDRYVSTGLLDIYCNPMALEYCKIHHNTRIVTVYPSATTDHRELLENFLKDNGKIVYQTSFNLTENGLLNLIKELYFQEEWMGNYQNQFRGAIPKQQYCSGTFPLRIYVYQTSFNLNIVDVKEKIRGLYGLGKHSVHINDTHTETLRIARCVLNENSIHFLNNATMCSPSTHDMFNKFYNIYSSLATEQQESIIIDSSFVMAMYGIRDARDVDFIPSSVTTPQTINTLTEMLNTDNHTTEFKKFSNNSIDDLIYNPKNYFYYHNIKFMTLNNLKDFKTIRNEPKDIIDIELIKSVL